MLKKKKCVNDFEESSKLYFKEIDKYTPLSHEEEIKLWKSYKLNNDLSARDKLVHSNLKFVASVASYYQGRGLSYSDLIAEGNYGLLKAMEKFDYTKGYKTISYSVWWIRQAILEALNERNGIEGEELPCEYEKQGGEEDDLTPSYSIQNEYFIDEYWGEEEQKRQQRRELIKSLTKQLSMRENFIITRYYGLDYDSPMTLEEIGDELSLTKERVRQILVTAFKKIRSEALKINVLECLSEI